jgi:uncharacterized protein (TIGR02996 family)
MPVWFVYRSFDKGPTGKYVRRFEDDNVLGWFQRHWNHLCIEGEAADDRLAEVVGCEGWFLWNPFRSAAEGGVARPETHEALMSLLRGSLEMVRSDSPHDLQVWTEEDGEGGAIYYFDGHFLGTSPALTTYLLHEDWRLPSGQGEGLFTPAVETIPFEPSEGPGVTYFAMLIRESKYPLDDLPVGYRVEGVRLPDLARRLCARPLGQEWSGYHRSLPALMFAGVELRDLMDDAFLRAVRAAPDDPVTWAAWSDWRQERGEEPPGISLLRSAFSRFARIPGQLQPHLPVDDDLDTACRRLLELVEKHRSELKTSPKSLIHVEPHLAQMCLDGSWIDEPYFDQLIFFDDLWASVHPDLADAILRFACRWDVLSAGPEE